MVKHQLTPSYPPHYIDTLLAAKIQVDNLLRFLRAADRGGGPFPPVKPEKSCGLLPQGPEYEIIHSHVPGAFPGNSVNNEMPFFFHGIPKKKERATGFEPATPSLGSSYSTTELCPLFHLRLIARDKNVIIHHRFVNTSWKMGINLVGSERLTF